MAERGDPGHVVATYREIAVRFGLGGVNAARTKAKRAGWAEEPTNHPAETKRIRVPREAWDQAGRDPPIMPPESAPSRPGREGPSRAPETGAIAAVRVALDLLRGQLERERARGDAAVAQAERSRDAALIAEEEAAVAERRAAEAEKAATGARRRAEEAEGAALDAWRIAAELADRLVAAQPPAAPVRPPSAPPRRRGYVARLLGR